MTTRAGGWLQGKTVRKGGALSSAAVTRSSTPQQVQSTSSTIFGGGVKDPSGRTAEYFVRSSPSFVGRSAYLCFLYSQWMINAQYARVIAI
jgi:hypothetical protein